MQRIRRTRENEGETRNAQHDAEPKPPFPPQHQEKPGLEGRMTPKPRYMNPPYKGADKLMGKAALVTGGDSGIGGRWRCCLPARGRM